MRRVRDWFFTVPLLAAIAVTLLSLDPAIRVAWLFGQERMDRMINLVERLVVRAFRICRVTLEVEAADGFDRSEAAILLANHQSNFDIPLLGALLGAPHPRFAATKQLWRWIPVVSFSLRHGGHAVVDRDAPRDTLRAIRDMAVSSQQDSVPMVIFPEGKRARDGELLEFQVAGTSTMLRAAPEMPVVPVTIDGAWSLMLHALFPTPYGHRIRVRFGDPMTRVSASDTEEILLRAREDIAHTLKEWRAAGLVGH